MARPSVQQFGSLLDRLPPHAIEAEAAVLGAMILDGHIIGDMIQTLSAADFWKQQHTTIYRALVDLWEADPAIDMVRLNAHLTDAGTLEEVGGLPYLLELSQATPSTASAPHYAAIVRDKSMLRKLIDVGGTILTDAYTKGTVPAVEQINTAEAKIFAIAQNATATDTQQTIGQVVQDAYDEAERRDGQGITGLETGFYELDEMLCGLQNGDLIIVAARPSMGKTALALDIARHVTTGKGVPTLFFSMEMSRSALGSRLMCAAARVDTHKLRRQMLGGDDYSRLAEVVGTLIDIPLHIDDVSGLTLMALRARARRMASKDSIGMIVVDYVQLMTSPGHESRQVEVSALSRGIKALARELDVPVLCISQLNRGPEARENHRPRMSDLRESGSLEQDADVVMLLHREDAYHRGDDDYEVTRTAELIVAKQRNGPTGMVRLMFDEGATTFHNLATGSDCDGQGTIRY